MCCSIGMFSSLMATVTSVNTQELAERILWSGRGDIGRHSCPVFANPMAKVSCRTRSQPESAFTWLCQESPSRDSHEGDKNDDGHESLEEEEDIQDLSDEVIVKLAGV